MFPLDVEQVCSRCNTLRGQGNPPLDGPDIEVPWITSKKETVLENRFELRLTEQEMNALNALAQRKGVSKSKFITTRIRQSAKRAKVWK